MNDHRSHGDRRRQHVEAAWGSMRLEGLEPPDDVKAIAERYINGELDRDSYLAELLDSGGLEPSAYLQQRSVTTT